MHYKFKIDVNKTVGRFSPKYSRAQKFLDNEVLKDSSPYTPFRTGALMRSGVTGTRLGSGEVKWAIEYAQSCYYGRNMNFSKKKHPQACSQWFEKAKSAKKEAWLNGVRRIIKGG